jgi:protein-tyrosine phosphatase
MAEVMLRRRLDERLAPAQVRSAGLTAEDQPATEAAAQVAADLGLDLGAHRSRVVSPDLVDSSDLIVGLAREHVREVVLLAPGAFGRTFTLKEIVRRGGEVGPRRPDEALDRWLARLHEGRTTRLHLGASADDDVEDPIGRRPAVYERVGDELAVLVDQLVELVWPAEEPLTKPAGPNELAAT